MGSIHAAHPNQLVTTQLMAAWLPLSSYYQNAADLLERH
jgi:hypothetical protein